MFFTKQVFDLYKKYTLDEETPFAVSVRWPWMPGRMTGITLGPVVVLRYSQKDRPDVAVHELVHVRQYYDNLIIGFVFKYLLSSSFRDKVELEAYQVQRKVQDELGMHTTLKYGV